MGLITPVEGHSGCHRPPSASEPRHVPSPVAARDRGRAVGPGELAAERADETDLARLGVVRDPAVLRELSRQVELLSQALTIFVNAFSPEVIVLSGYLGVLYSVARERLSEAVRIQPLGAEGRTVRLERAHLRSRLMQVGPAELAFADLLTNPGVVRTSA